MNGKAYAIIVIWSVMCGSLHSLTYNHLRILDAVEKNRTQIKAYAHEFKEIFRSSGEVDSLEELVNLLERLDREYAEAVYLMSQLERAAKEEKIDADKCLEIRTVGGLCEEIDDEVVVKYDVLFRRLASILGVWDVREIPGAMVRLKRKCDEAKDLLRQMSGFVQEHKECAA